VTVRDLRFAGIGRGGFSATAIIASSFFLHPSSFRRPVVEALEPVVVPGVSKAPVLLARVEEAETFADSQVPLHVTPAGGTPVQLIPAIGFFCHPALIPRP